MKRFACARDLPPDWEALCGDNPYLHREFLAFLETVDQCGQSYFLFRDTAGAADAILMTYVRPDFNLLMFTPVTSAFRTTFVYVPLSVARPGIAGPVTSAGAVAAFIRKIPGLTLVLNTQRGFRMDGFIQAKTFPRCVLSLQWRTLEEYLGSLRSGYRHRCRKALTRSRPLTYRILDDNAAFDDRLYALYEQVYENSPYRIEKLTPAFFRGGMFKIGVFKLDGRPVGFIQLLENGDELIFEFVGFDHALNHRYDIYISLLLKIIEYGVDHGFRQIDFGQTADEAKLKLGCRYEPLYALLHHSNPLMHLLLRMCIRTIQYTPLDESTFHVFKTPADRGGKDAR